MIGPALAMLAIGAGAAILLAVAAKVFYVEVDPRVVAVEDSLPGANCGGCGYTGCGACREAIGAWPISAVKVEPRVVLTASDYRIHYSRIGADIWVWSICQGYLQEDSGGTSRRLQG